MRERKKQNVEIGQRIRSAREAAKMTQERLSMAIDVSVQYISDLERGVVGASVSTIIKLSNALHVTTDYLLLGKVLGPGVSQIVSKSQYLPPEKRDIIDRNILLLMEAFGQNYNDYDEE